MDAGECVQCGALNRLDAAGACPACAARVPCAKHPERASVTRCSGCGQPACRPCAPFGICEACAAQPPAPARPAAAAPPAAAPAPARLLDRRTLLFAGLSLLGAGLGALAARTLGDARTLAAQAEQASRLQAVWRLAARHRDAQGRWPADARPFARELPPGTVVLGPPDPPQPHAVVYEARGTELSLRLYDGEGRLVTRDGAPWVVTGF